MLYKFLSIFGLAKGAQEVTIMMSAHYLQGFINDDKFRRNIIKKLHVIRIYPSSHLSFKKR